MSHQDWEECLVLKLKAAVIAGAVCIIAEIDPIAANKRHQQGWLTELYEDLDEVVLWAQIAIENKKEAVSLDIVEI